MLSISVLLVAGVPCEGGGKVGLGVNGGWFKLPRCAPSRRG